MKDFIFIPGNVPSSKNSRMTSKATGRSFDSKQTATYKKSSHRYWQLYKLRFQELIADKTKPYGIGLLFIRDSNRRFDWVNPVQTVQDMMVKYGWLLDDNVNIMYPIPLIPKYSLIGSTSIIDKENPGVIIKPVSGEIIDSLRIDTRNERITSENNQYLL